MKLLTLLGLFFCIHVNAQKTVTLAQELKNIEAAADDGFEKYKQAVDGGDYDNYKSTIILKGASSVEIDRSLGFVYGPFKTYKELYKQRDIVLREIKKLRPDYLYRNGVNLFKDSSTWIAKTFKGGFYKHHITIINEERKDTPYFVLRFWNISDKSKNYYVTESRAGLTGFSADFFHVYNDIQNQFQKFKTTSYTFTDDYSPDTAFKSNFTIEQTTNNRVAVSTTFSIVDYIADIKLKVSKSEGYRLVEEWREELGLTLGTKYYHNTSFEDYSLRKRAEFKTIIPVKAPLKDYTIAIEMRENKEDKELYDITLMLSSYESWN